MQSRYDAVLATLDAGVVIYAADSSILDANECARALLGIRDLEGRPATDPHWVFLEVDGSPMALERFPVMQVINTEEEVRGLIGIVRPPIGPEVCVEVNASPIFGSAGQLEQIAVTFIDITERMRVVAELVASEGLLRVVLDNSPDTTIKTGLDGRIEYVNRRVVEVSGIPAEQWIGRPFDEMGYPVELTQSWMKHRQHVFATGEQITFEFDIDNAEGHRSYETTIAPGLSAAGTVVHTIETSRDITERRLASNALLEYATHDPLTGLLNRAGLLAECALALGAARGSGHATALLLMDLDRFKDVNDTLGHDVGDDLLIAAAARIQTAVRPGDLVARVGGDEFVVVMPSLDDPDVAPEAALLVVEAFRLPFSIREIELYSPVSIGLTLTIDGEDAGSLLRDADTALYAAKAAGRDRMAVFNEELRAAVTAKAAVATDLRHALDLGQLAVWYQPEINLTTGRVVALEALLRWHHPDGSVWTADRFVGVAEETGMIQEIGEWVLDQACHQAAVWDAERPDRPVKVRVNMSTLQIATPGLLPTLDEVLTKSGLNPANLCIEITETVLLRQSALARDNLAGFHERGVTLAIDDFGTGYASLTYLNHYPIDVIKIDRSFISDIALPHHDRRLVAGIIALAATLGIDVTAEGIEQQAQADLLHQMGCPSAQGFLFSRALPADEITPLLDHSYLVKAPALG